jgi:hypothetical protein
METNMSVSGISYSDVGREIVSNAIRSGDLQPYLDQGWDLEWCSDPQNILRLAVFPEPHGSAWRFILRHWEKHRKVPSAELFRLESPVYELTDNDHTPAELLEIALGNIRAVAVQDAMGDLQAYQEAGDWQAVAESSERLAQTLRSAAQPVSRFTVASMADVVPEQTRWLWDRRIPVGALSVTAGKPGIGKSQFAAWLSAQVTKGALPGDLYGTPRNVLYVFVEDSLTKTIVPRLRAAGADMDRMLQITSRRDPGRNLVPSLKTDLETIERMITDNDVALVVFDPIVSAVQTDRNKSDEIRPLLQGLADVAERTNCAVHGLMHLRKQAADDMLTMIGGSGDWGAIIRAALGFMRDNESDDLHTVVSQIKNNLGPMNLESKTFTIEPAEVRGKIGPISTSRLVWGEDSAWSAEEIMQGRKTDTAQSAAESCVEWLRDLLRHGPMEKSVVIAQGKSDGYAGRTIERAKQSLKIKNRKQGSHGPVFWELTDDPGRP